MTYECNEALADLLERLRTNQRNFFNSQPGSLARSEALGLSRMLEKELDRFLRERKEREKEQPNLFS